MPFYFRKSVSAGPFRFNFSKGGVGVSVGVKGLRIGAGPRGHYVRAGIGGIHYRASLGRAGEHSRSEVPETPPAISPERRSVHPTVEMIEVESSDVLGMRDERFSDLLDEINTTNGRRRMARVFPIVVGLVCGVAVVGAGAQALVALTSVPLAWICGKWIDSYRRSTVLFYEMDAEVESRYKRVVEAFDNLRSSVGKWHIAAGGAVKDLTTWKRNAGASHIVDKKPTPLDYKLPKILKCNLTPPSIGVGRQRVYLLPDVLLVEDGTKIGAVGYADLNISWQDSNFIETGRVPKDSLVVGHTWKYPNKKGGPDRRFNGNHQIPICRYEVMHMTSRSGLNEIVEFSKTGIVQDFARVVDSLPKQKIDVTGKMIGGRS